MSTNLFCDDFVNWKRFGEFDPAFYFSILHIDQANRIADVLFKFPAKKQILLHKHLALNLTFVLQGEHYLYEPDGSIKERRRCASYTISPASETPHREGGGDIDTIVFFSIRPGDQELLYDLLDDNEQLVGTVTFQMLVEMHTGNG